MTDDDFQKWIMKCEGFRSIPYKDTVGVLTIGYGTNLEQGITHEQAKALMICEIELCKHDLAALSWYINQPSDIKFALLNMCYNIGISRLIKFKSMIQYLKIKDYENAANAALDSEWAKQVGQRAKDIAEIIRKGK